LASIDIFIGAANLPRIFQANVDRLFKRTILRELNALPIHAELSFVETPSIDEFLLRVQAQTDNYVANEGAKAYTLALAGLFKRQLRIRARSRRASPLRDTVWNKRVRALVVDCAREADINLADKCLGQVLIEMFLVANVFRHGDGPSVAELRSHSPKLWERAIALCGPAPSKSRR